MLSKRCIALLFLVLTAHIHAAERLQFARSDGAKTPALHYPPVSVCLGTVIISHGAGGSENGLAYLGKFMQSKGCRSNA